MVGATRPMKSAHFSHQIPTCSRCEGPVSHCLVVRILLVFVWSGDCLATGRGRNWWRAANSWIWVFLGKPPVFWASRTPVLKINRNEMIANDRDGWAKKWKYKWSAKWSRPGEKKMKKAKWSLKMIAHQNDRGFIFHDYVEDYDRSF